MGEGDAFPVEWASVFVERAERGQVAEVGAIAGGQQDRVDFLAAAVGPGDLGAVDTREQLAPVRSAGGDSGPVSAVVDHQLGRRRAQKLAERQSVGPDSLQPPVQILAQRALGREAHRVSRGEGDPGVRGQVGGDLNCGVPGADDHHALPGERLRHAVLGRVQHCAGEAL